MDEKIRRKNMFLTNKIARKAFCVGGRCYPIGIFNWPHVIASKNSNFLINRNFGQKHKCLSKIIISKNEVLVEMNLFNLINWDLVRMILQLFAVV